MGSVRAMADIRNLGLPSNEVLDERLLSFLAAYHNANAGQSPALDVICSQTGLPEEIVRQTIARLETRGLIHVISRNPLRIMLSDGRQPAQEIPPAPVEWRPQPTAGALQYVETSALVMELIERGYIVKRGN